MGQGRARGFSLIELVVSLVVAAILAAAAIPSMLGFTTNNRAAAQTNEFVGAVLLARSEAVTRALPVTLCALPAADVTTSCATGSNPVYWDYGWMIFVDTVDKPGELDSGDQVLKVFPALRQGDRLKASTSSLLFQSDGFLGSSAVSLALTTGKCYSSSNRNISVSKGGHASVKNAPC